MPLDHLNFFAPLPFWLSVLCLKTEKLVSLKQVKTAEKFVGPLMKDTKDKMKQHITQ